MKLLQKTAAMPIGAVAAFMGAATLSNAWNAVGFGWVWLVTMIAAAVVWLLFLGRIVFSFASVRAEYGKVVPASLYGAFFMLLMILSMWLYPLMPGIARPLFLGGFALHVLHIVVFTVRNVCRSPKAETFLPCWFVTYNGIMVSTALGAPLLGPVAPILLYYGLCVYALLIVLLVVRLATKTVPAPFLHTTAVVLAPASLCITSYLNVATAPRLELVVVLYGLLLVSLLFIIVNIPRYFAVAFNPGFAGLTFPMAIGCVASIRTATWLDAQGFAFWSGLVRQMGGLQFWLATAIIAFVLYNFGRLGFGALRKKGE